jgi:hypothetical protein
MTRLITRVFTIPEAAEFLRVDVATVNALIEGGKLRTFSTGAYRHTTLEAISDYIHEAEVDLPTTIADVCLRYFTSPTTEGRAPAIVRYAAEAFGLDLKETSVSAILCKLVNEGKLQKVDAPTIGFHCYKKA